MTEYTLRDALNDQDELQSSTYGGQSPRDLTGEARLQFIRVNVLALEDELHEALGETGWKPWATSDHVNEAAFQSELVDALHFLLNLMLAGHIDADEFLAEYQAKRLKNKKRQAEGYDGVSTKCPGCKRALDDTNVPCRRGNYVHADSLVPGIWCMAGYPQALAKFYPDEVQR